MEKQEGKGTEKSSGSMGMFLTAIGFCAAIAIWGVISPESMTNAARDTTRYFLMNLDWFFLLLCTFLVILSLYLAFGPYSHIKLGGDDEEPEFSTLSWISMLFAAGMGCGLLFWGVAEPMHHYISPPAMQGRTPQAARMAMVLTNFHWGLHAWGIYAVSALVLAYFGFRKGKPYLPSVPIRAEFTGKFADKLAHITDIIAVLSVVFGVAGSLAMGILQINSGMGAAFGLPTQSITIRLIVLVAITILFLLSASTGLDKGIKILSNINMITAVVLLLFIIFVGQTRFIFEILVNTFGDYVSNLINLSFKLYPYRGLQDWSASWTLTYLIWWVAWGPFVGIFIARISRGRTIRQFMLGVLFIPTVFCILWFAAFGGSAFYIEMQGTGLGEMVRQNPTTALFSFFGYYPFSTLLNIIALFLIFIFLVTSADSATFVVGMITSKGKLNPPTMRKIMWGVIIAALSASALFSSKGVEVSKAIAISGAIPFSIILLLQIIGFMRAIRHEKLDK